MAAIKDTYSYQPELTDKFKTEFVNQYHELNKLPIKEWLVVGKAVLYLQGLIPSLNEMEIWIVGPHRRTMRKWFYENSDKCICEDNTYIDSDDDDVDEAFPPVPYKTSIEGIYVTVKIICYGRIINYFRTNEFNLSSSIFSRLNQYLHFCERKAFIMKGSIMIHNYFSKWRQDNSIYIDTFEDTYRKITVYNPPSTNILHYWNFY